MRLYFFNEWLQGLLLAKVEFWISSSFYTTWCLAEVLLYFIKMLFCFFNWSTDTLFDKILIIFKLKGLCKSLWTLQILDGILSDIIPLPICCEQLIIRSKTILNHHPVCFIFFKFILGCIIVDMHNILWFHLDTDRYTSIAFQFWKTFIRHIIEVKRSSQCLLYSKNLERRMYSCNL